MAQTATILVTDLAGSTETRVQLGEARAEELRRAHDSLLTEQASQHSDATRDLRRWIHVARTSRRSREAVGRARVGGLEVRGHGRSVRARADPTLNDR